MSSAAPNTRERILEATWRLMEVRRGRGVRMADVSRAAGVSRQALYLHFGSRAELMVATLRWGDEVRGVDERLDRYRSATTGVGMLEELVAFWAGHVPQIYGIATALLAVRESDEAAAAAWQDRMAAVRGACRDVVAALERDGALAEGLAPARAVDLLWTLLSVRNWESLTVECGWSERDYAKAMTRLARRALVGGETARGGGSADR